MMNPFGYVPPKEMICRVLIGMIIVSLFVFHIFATIDEGKMKKTTELTEAAAALQRKHTKRLIATRAIIKLAALGVLGVNSVLASNSVPGSLMILAAMAITSSPPVHSSTSILQEVL